MNPIWQTQNGDPELQDHVIFKTVVGSELHGLHIPGTEDHDIFGIAIPTPEKLLGVQGYEHHFIARTAKEGARSRHGDTDLNLYSLQKYLKLAAAGNPTVLLPLWAPEEFILQASHWGFELRSLRRHFITLNAGQKFLGYLDGQLNDLKAGQTGKRIKRPELVEQFGYDTKFASHAMRLAFQGVDLLLYRRLPLPMIPVQRSICMRIKEGRADFDTALSLIEVKRAELIRVLENPPKDIPERVDMAMLDKWAADLTQRFWESEGL